jgi:hypothetical protein
MITFELEPNEAVFVVQVLGQLPTQSNAHPLWQKLAQQLQAQQKEGEGNVS